MRTLIAGPGRMRFHTNLAQVFEALDGRQREFGWLVTHYECNRYVPGFALDSNATRAFLSGAELTALAGLPNAPQFIWGVLTGFDARTVVDPDPLALEPWADGNLAVWDPSGGPQVPGAAIEIVCFDSSCTIVTSEDDEIHRCLRTYFPEAKPMPPLPSRG